MTLREVLGYGFRPGCDTAVVNDKITESYYKAGGGAPALQEIPLEIVEDSSPCVVSDAGPQRPMSTRRVVPMNCLKNLRSFQMSVERA